MTDPRMRIPNDDHPITIAANPAPVTVSSDGGTIARTSRALVLREASYPPVQYVPRGDADMTRLARSAHKTHCPYKGEAAYFDIVALGEKGRNAVWSYEAPFDAVSPIAGHLAFYPDRVSIAEG